MYVFAVIGLTLSGSVQAQQQNGTADQAPANEQDATDQLPFTLPVVIIESDEASEARQSGETERTQREKDDLVAQQGMNAATQAMNNATQSMKWASWVSTGLVGLGTALLIWTLCLTRSATSAAKGAVAVTENIGKAQSRAYVHVKSIHMKAIDVEGEKKSSCTFYIENSGVTPCKRFEICGGVDIKLSNEKIDALPKFEAKGVGWSALKGTEVLKVARDFDMPEISDTTESYCVHIGGVIKYTTFFDEEFETEFSFSRRVNLDRAGVQVMGPNGACNLTANSEMSRTTLEIRVYEKTNPKD